MLIGDLDLPNVCFEGFASDAGLAAYYRAADVYVCSSAHEGYGLPLVEAFAGCLSESERVLMAQEAGRATTKAGGPMSEVARAERMRFEEARWTRQRFGIPDLVGVLLG